MRRIIIILLAATIFSSCTNSKISSTLQKIESYIEHNPQMALEEIRAISLENLLISSRNRAKLSLLHSMALDKNFIDLNTDSVIAPAVKYYDKSGSADDKLLTHYYMGRIYENGGKLDDAALEYSKAEKLLKDVKNRTAVGRLYSSLADIFNRTHNTVKELEYANKAYNEFNIVLDGKYSNISKGLLGMAYANAREYDIADSLYKNSIEGLADDTLSITVFLENYARLKVLKPNPEPNEAIALLERIYKEFRQPLSANSYCIYAYAMQQLGREEYCEVAIKQLEMSNCNQLDYWKYLIYEYRGQHDKALFFLKKSVKLYEKETIERLSNTVDQKLKEFYAVESDIAHMQMKINVMFFIIMIMFIVAVLSGIVYKLMRSNQRKQHVIESYLNLYKNAGKLILDYENRLGEQNTDLERLKTSFADVYKKRFTAIGDLCFAYLTKQNRKDIKDHIYRKVEKLVANITLDDKMHFQLERQLNLELDNIIAHLRLDMPKMTNEDIRFICYCIIGFDAALISTIFNMSESNVYTKKFRIKSRIKALESQYKEQYLRFL